MRREQRIRILGSAAVMLMVIGLFLALQPYMAMNNGWASIFMAGVVLLAIIANVAIIRRNAHPELDTEKRKRGLDGQDMYTLIDRMVDNLDGEELDYLRQRLEVRERGSKHELAESLGDLLDEREEYRESGRL